LLDRREHRFGSRIVQKNTGALCIGPHPRIRLPLDWIGVGWGRPTAVSVPRSPSVTAPISFSRHAAAARTSESPPLSIATS
jgi:hypothetical protein